MKLNLPTGTRRLRRLAAVLAALGAYAALTALLIRRYDVAPGGRRHVEIVGGSFHVDGRKFLIKGVGWDPARPGELPWKQQRSRARLESDLARIRAAGFNTIRTWEALSRDELEVAERHGLKVLQGIWIDPAGPFDDAEFRRRSVEKVSRLAHESRGSRAILAYVVLNEPHPEAVLAAGVDATRSLIRDLAAAVRREDPGIPVGFANWPGVEHLNESTLDFAAANLYPFRPSTLLEAAGYDGLVRLWKETSAPDRPLLVTEFGVSVAPGTPRPDGPGGATEEEQAEALPRLADAILRSGAAGGCVFMWIDGWWKNADQEGDERSHDPDDGEEWFGLNAMDDLKDVTGRPRPALEAIRHWNRAVLTLPADGPAPSREVEVEIHTEEPDVRVEASVNGGEPVVVPVVRDGPWLRGRLGLAARASGPQRLVFSIAGREGRIREVERVVVPAGEEWSLTLEGADRWVARVRDAAGRPVEGVEVRFAATEPTRRFNGSHAGRTDANGEAAWSPSKPPLGTILYVAAVARRAPGGPPAALAARVWRLE